MTNLLIQYIQERGKDKKEGKETPFFAVLSVQPPHNPYVAPADTRRRYTPGQIKLRPNVPNIPAVRDEARRDLAGYYAMIENLDWNVGRIQKALEEAGLSFNTHIIFFSDHGDMHGSHGQRHKTTPYEEAIRIPFIIGGEKPVSYEGRRHGSFAVPINHVDIAPTTLGLCNIPKPDWMEGTDYSHYRIKKQACDPEPDSAYIQSVIPTGHHDSVDKPWRGIVTRDGWKHVCFEGIPWLMFNLNEDPYEQVNLAHNTKYREERKKLYNRLAGWINDTGDSFKLPEY